MGAIVQDGSNNMCVSRIGWDGRLDHKTIHFGPAAGVPEDLFVATVILETPWGDVFQVYSDVIEFPATTEDLAAALAHSASSGHVARLTWYAALGGFLGETLAKGASETDPTDMASAVQFAFETHVAFQDWVMSLHSDEENGLMAAGRLIKEHFVTPPVTDEDLWALIDGAGDGDA